MDITETMYAPEREAWRAWLQENHRAASEIWLVTYKKQSGKPSIPYNHAVEEALCFGWIDSIRKSLGVDRLAQRFTPRKSGRGYSQTNLERLRRLRSQNKIRSEILPEVEAVLAEAFHPPPEVMARLQADAEAWTNFQRYSPAYQRIRLAYIQNGRNRPGEFEKRLVHFLKKTRNDKQFGYGIEEYY